MSSRNPSTAMRLLLEIKAGDMGRPFRKLHRMGARGRDQLIDALSDPALAEHHTLVVIALGKGFPSPESRDAIARFLRDHPDVDDRPVLVTLLNELNAPVASKFESMTWGKLIFQHAVSLLAILTIFGAVAFIAPAVVVFGMTWIAVRAKMRWFLDLDFRILYLLALILGGGPAYFLLDKLFTGPLRKWFDNGDVSEGGFEVLLRPPSPDTSETPTSNSNELNSASFAVTTALEHLWNGPKSNASLPARRPDLDTIEAAAWQVSCEQWRAYVAAWGDPNLAAEHEQAFPGLAALGIATRHVVEQVRKTRVRRGMLLWHVYNMGFFLKTPRACVGIDVCGPGVEALADSLDALLITHAHRDHVHLGLITAMLHREKPVVSSFVDGDVRFTKAGAWDGCPGLSVSIDIGDHHYTRPECVNDMLMFHVDAGQDGAIYHTGDNSNAIKLATGRRCDAWMFHVRVGLDVPLALRRIDPRMAIGAHVLELGHPPERFRWRFGDALEKLSCWPADRGSVPVWGECYRLAGAEIDTHDEDAAT